MPPLVIKAYPPFNFAATAEFLRSTDREIVDQFADGEYRRLIHFENCLHLVSVRASGTSARPTLNVWLAPEPEGASISSVAEAAADVVRRIFSVNHNLKSFAESVADDSVMRDLEAAYRGLRLARLPTLFENLVISILSQQISTLVAMTLKRRLVERFGEQLTVQGRRYFAFPHHVRLARASTDELRALGISTAKAASIIELARASVDGSLNADELEGRDNESIIASLSRLKGVGRWTAEWGLILYFGRTDVFPAGDLALRLFAAKYYNNGIAMSERDVRRFAAERWGAWGSYVAVYFFAGLRNGLVTLR